MRCGGQSGTYMRQEDDAGVWWGDLAKRAHMEDLDVDGRIIIIKSIFTKWDEEAHGLGLSAALLGQEAGACICGNKISAFIKCREFLDQLRTCQILRNDSAPRSQSVSKSVSQSVSQSVS